MASSDPYFLFTSPPLDYNPIEQAFHEVKAYLRRRNLHSSAHPDSALFEACAHVSAEHACNYFRNAGYDVPAPPQEAQQQQQEFFTLLMAYCVQQQGLE